MDDLLWVGPALIAGILASRFNLPPMVGYLVCGFILNLSGAFDHDRLTMIGDLGVTLLLFTIGLKLDLRSLLKPVIWVGTTLHMTIVIAVFGTMLFWLSLTGLQAFSGLDISSAMLIGFALSFSSTVFAVKTLEDKGEYQSKYGQIAIGVLIMQDIFAVIFLTASTGTLPSIWALALLLLIPARFVLMQLLSKAGHTGELQTLYGLALAFGGYTLFDAVDVKGDLGALIIGAMLASHPLAGDVAKRLLAFKDLLLVGFFLSIGMSGSLTFSSFLIALFLTVLVILKVILFFALFSRFQLRARNATLSSLVLGNYSEFGLIVGAIAVSNLWITEDWLVTIALALTMTIILAAPLNMRALQLYNWIRPTARRFETEKILSEDKNPTFCNAHIAVIGMGRIGTRVYDQLVLDYGEVLIGIDNDHETISKHKGAGRNVIYADATNDDMWEGATELCFDVGVLAMKNHQENLCLAKRVSKRNPAANLFAYAKYDDEVEELVDAGVKVVWNMYSELGVGIASEVLEHYGAKEKSSRAPADIRFRR